MTSNSIINKNLYLFNSRIFTHIVFWMVYYVTFSLVWAKDGNYYASFGLEFVLLPIRISAAYVTMYYLIPRLLLRDQLTKFVGYLILTLLLAGVLQRVFIYFFYELFFADQVISLWEIEGIIRAMILVNSTVLLLSAIKMYQHWRIEYEKNLRNEGELIEIRSEKRIYRINPSEIIYIEGLGNYVTYYFENRKPLISYNSLKEVEAGLPSTFHRIHKSFIVNKNWVESYTADNVEVKGRILPIGKSVELTF